VVEIQQLLTAGHKDAKLGRQSRMGEAESLWNEARNWLQCAIQRIYEAFSLADRKGQAPSPASRNTLRPLESVSLASTPI
jgi:hypothetical protein